MILACYRASHVGNGNRKEEPSSTRSGGTESTGICTSLDRLTVEIDRPVFTLKEET